jgi:hypothetical protein
MSRDRARRLIAHLADLLERERDLLLDGRFDALEAEAAARDLQARQLAALPREALEGEAGALRALRIAAERNMALLRAALEGAAAGRARLAEIVDARARLRTYDESGAPVERAATLAEGRRA